MAIPFGRRSTVEDTARQVWVWPSECTTVTPPGHSGTKTSPERVATTHSGRLRPVPWASSALTGMRSIDTEFNNVYDTRPFGHQYRR